MNKQTTYLPNTTKYFIESNDSYRTLAPADHMTDEVIETLDIGCVHCQSSMKISAVVSESWSDRKFDEVLSENLPKAICNECADHFEDRGREYSEDVFEELECFTDLNPIILYEYQEPEWDEDWGSDR